MLVMAWKDTPSELKRLVLFLFPTLFISSLIFSWLREARNFMPLVVVMAVVAGRHLSSTLGENATSAPATAKARKGNKSAYPLPLLSKLGCESVGRIWQNGVGWNGKR